MAGPTHAETHQAAYNASLAERVAAANHMDTAPLSTGAGFQAGQPATAVVESNTPVNVGPFLRTALDPATGITVGTERTNPFFGEVEIAVAQGHTVYQASDKQVAEIQGAVGHAVLPLGAAIDRAAQDSRYAGFENMLEVDAGYGGYGEDAAAGADFYHNVLGVSGG